MGNTIEGAEEGNIYYHPIKIVVVGDGMVGKTFMLQSYTDKLFPEESNPNVLENCAVIIKVDHTKYNMSVWVTAGEENYERIRPLLYPNTQCFLLCFAVNNRASYENVYERWTPEIRLHCSDVPIVLVGTQIDLREDSNSEHVTENDGNEMRRKIKAAAYVECSAKKMVTLDTVFHTVVSCAMGTYKPPRKGNIILQCFPTFFSSRSKRKVRQNLILSMK